MGWCGRGGELRRQSPRRWRLASAILDGGRSIQQYLNYMVFDLTVLIGVWIPGLNKMLFHNFTGSSNKSRCCHFARCVACGWISRIMTPASCNERLPRGADSSIMVVMVKPALVAVNSTHRALSLACSSAGMSSGKTATGLSDKNTSSAMGSTMPVCDEEKINKLNLRMCRGLAV